MHKPALLVLALAGLLAFAFTQGGVRNSGPQQPAGTDAAMPEHTAGANHAAQSATTTNTNAPNAPPDNQERPKLKARYSRWLLDQLDRVDGGTDQDRALIRDTLSKNDDTLDRAFRNMSGRIRAANNTHDGPRRIYIPE